MPPPVHESREGFAIFVVLIGVLVLSTLTLTALDMGTQESRSARATRVSASALYAAETGVSVVRAGTWPSLALGGTWDGGQVTLPNGSRYRPVIQRRDNGVGRMQIYSLTVEGWSPSPRGGEASVQVWATRFVIGLFESALGARGNVTLSGNPGSVIDSYDSRLGDYGALLGDGSTNKDSTGSVLANGNVNLSGTAQVLGNVAVSGTINNSSGNPDAITGTETTGATKIDYPVENCPDYTPIATVYKLEGGKGNVKIENLTYTLTSGTYSFHEFVMGGGSGATLVIPAGNTVKIYLSGKLDAGGSNTVINNQSKDPRSLSFSACNRAGLPTNTDQWNLTGGSGAYMTVWAPNNKVYLQGSSPLFGAVVANDFTADQGASIHYDLALGQSNALSTIMPRSWRQLLR